MKSGHHPVRNSVLIAGAFALLSGVGTAAADNHGAAAVETAARIPSISRSLTARQVRRAAVPRPRDSAVTSCGHPFFLIIGIGY